MARRIIQLDPKTINQIAAGEVVENPASVVKELVENSIDAGSSSITIEILDGGFSLIKIIDDGMGFEKEDLGICLHRHTTSKLKKIEDLWEIPSMGFRGEALASIAGISEFSILTKSKDAKQEESGNLLKNYPYLEITPYPRDYGTTIEVRSLFYNVPARKAFQKTSGHSLSEITKVITKIALAFPYLKIKFIAQGKTIIDHQGDSTCLFIDQLKKATNNVLDKSYLEEGFILDEESEDIKFQGYLGSFQKTRSQRTGQFLFINKRPIVSPLLSQVIKNAYGTRIDASAHPIFVIHISMPYDQVDINVHPQKKEVRFRDENHLCEKLKKAVIKSLLNISKDRVEAFTGFSNISYNSFQNYENKKPQTSFGFSVKPKLEWNAEKIPYSYIEPKKEENFYQKSLMMENHTIPIHGKLYDYLIVSTEDLDFLDLSLSAPITLIHSKALKSRIYFEDRKKAIGASNFRQQLQSLLFPISLDFDLATNLLIEKQLELFPIFGIELIRDGSGKFSIVSLLPEIKESEALDWVDKIVKELDHIDEEEVLQQLLRKMVKKIQWDSLKISEKELYILLKELSNFEERMFSPLGEKIFISLSNTQLEKLCQ